MSIPEMGSDSDFGGRPTYVGTSRQELVDLELDAWEQGARQADADGSAALTEFADIDAAANAACEDTLRIYIPLDLARFRDVYTRGWAAGYYARVRRLGMLNDITPPDTSGQHLDRI